MKKLFFTNKNTGIRKDSGLGLRFRTDHDLTIGVEFGARLINIKNKNIKLQIWDTAGQEVYGSIIGLYYKDANGCLIVFDVCNRESFLNCQSWLKKVKNTNCTKVVITLVGNKIDKYGKRVVSREEAEIFSKENGINYIETSAKDNIDCEKAFYETSVQIYYRMIEKPDKYLPYIKKGASIINRNNDIIHNNLNRKKHNKQKYYKYPSLLSHSSNLLEIDQEDMINREEKQEDVPYCCVLQ